MFLNKTKATCSHCSAHASNRPLLIASDEADAEVERERGATHILTLFALSKN